MDRLSYFNTARGQENLRIKRKYRRLDFYIDQNPGSKKISDKEKIDFQQKIYAKLKEGNRNAYRSPIILEIDFYSNQDNPPSIYTMAKNYLDLLGKPIQGTKIHRKRLLYNDDKLIKILIANYHLGTHSEIRIKAAKLSDFLEDVQLITKIIDNDFEEEEDYELPDINDFPLEPAYSLEEIEKDIRDIRKNKEDIIKNNGAGFYAGHEDFLLRIFQKEYLALRELRISQLVQLFSVFWKSDQNSAFDVFKKDVRKHFLTFPYSLSLRGVPSRAGESKFFKRQFEKTLNDFKQKHPLMFPLKNLLSVTIFCVQAENAKNVRDLDNLAGRFLIPIVHQIMEPPNVIAKTIDIGNLSDPQLKSKWVEIIKMLPKIPENSVVRYQIIELPRDEQDPKEGIVSIVFENGFDYRSLWSKVDDFLGKWNP